MTLFITKLFEEPAYYLYTVLSFAASICIHEYSHAFVAHRLGDNTAKEGGFMTLNPLKVMGWFSIVALLLFGFSWGAVPVRRDNPSRWRRSAISLAGPLSNLALMGLIALLLKGVFTFAPGAAPNAFVSQSRLFLLCALYANAILFLFNIVPIPSLDGYGAIEPFLPPALIPDDQAKRVLFRLFIYLVCFSSASGYFGKGIEFFTAKFFPAQMNAILELADGNKAFDADDYTGAYEAFEKAASKGSPEGCLQLAVCLAEGHGCQKDPERAFALFSRADVRSFPLAKFYTGLMLMLGDGCPQDAAKAREILSSPDVQETFPLARSNLGVLLAEGLGGPQDSSGAFDLFNDQEVLQVSPAARFYLARYLMDGEICHKNESRAYRLLDDEEVLEFSPIARFHLAILLMNGEGCRKDEQRAFTMMNDETVLEALPSAKYLLGIWYYAGAGTPQNFAEAARLLKVAADAGEPNAAEFLGYENGKMPEYSLPLAELLEHLWQENH